MFKQKAGLGWGWGWGWGGLWIEDAVRSEIHTIFIYPVLECVGFRV